MSKRNHFNNVRTFLFAVVCTLLASTAFYACKKSNDKAPVVEEELTLKSTDRLLSVANVYYNEGGKSVTALFYETPLVHEFSSSLPNSTAYFNLLNDAKTKGLPINVRVTDNRNGKIEAVIAATPEQVKTYNESKAEVELAEEVENPETVSNSNRRLTGVIPNMTTLNNIFAALRNQCCKLAGPYLYGQCVPYQYVADGCYARAHKMRQIIEGTYGYTSYKVFNYADQCPTFPGVLAVNATLWNNNCCVRWWYHVAPYVYVQSGTSQVAYLLDPSMHSAPVAISTWLNAQKNTGCGYTNGTVHKQAYYTSSAYTPSGYNFSTCTIQVGVNNTYTAANSTCSAYSGLQGCF
jgi:Glutaminase